MFAFVGRSVRRSHNERVFALTPVRGCRCQYRQYDFPSRMCNALALKTLGLW